MRVNKKVISFIVASGVLIGSIPYNVFADSVNVVTIGANLSEAQREKMFEFFGTNEDEVMVIEVTNDDERKYLGGIASEEQIGKKTFSCSYVEPTTDGGINVKTANLTYVTSAMIASTLVTSGVENANVLASAPLAVSGTGALTGIMMAYEQSSGEKLDEEKKELASEELITTGDLSEEVGQEKATGIINDIKTEIIKNNTQDTTQIAETINNVTNNYNVTLSAGQVEAIQGLMEKVAKQDYNYDAIKGTLGVVTENVDKGLEALGEKVKRGSFFENLMASLQGLFAPKQEEESKDLGILANTNDEVLGDNAKIDATDESVVDTEALKEEAKGFIDSIVNWLNRLIGATNTNSTEGSQVPGEQDTIVEENIESEESMLEEGTEDSQDVEVIEENEVEGIVEDTDTSVSNEVDGIETLEETNTSNEIE